ncbi:hypothetical protein D3C78_1913600 [compost metagenome]
MILQQGEHRALEGKDETGGLVRILAEQGAAVGELFEELPNRVPARRCHVLSIALLQSANQ